MNKNPTLLQVNWLQLSIEIDNLMYVVYGDVSSVKVSKQSPRLLLDVFTQRETPVNDLMMPNYTSRWNLAAKLTTWIIIYR